MTRNNFGFAVIGAGNIGSLHAEVIRRLPGGKLVAVSNRSSTRGEALAQKYGCGYFSDYRRAIEHPQVHIVNVCTPSGDRVEIIKAAAAAGKHVISEKPLEVTLARCDQIIQSCDRHGVKLATIFPQRFYESNRLAKRAVSGGRLGRLVLGDASVKWYRSQAYYDSGDWRGTWALDGGGALMNQSIHSIDLLQWLYGPVRSISAWMTTLAHDRIKVEDVATAALEFKDGGLGVIQGSTAIYPGFPAQVALHGTAGSIVLKEGQIADWKLADADGEEETCMLAVGQAGNTGGSDPMGISSVGHERQISDMIQAIREDRPPLIDGQEGRKAVEIVLGVYRAARESQPIYLPLSEE